MKCLTQYGLLKDPCCFVVKQPSRARMISEERLFQINSTDCNFYNGWPYNEGEPRYILYFIRCSRHGYPKMMLNHPNLDDGLPHDDGGYGHDNTPLETDARAREEVHQIKRDVCQGECPTKMKMRRMMKKKIKLHRITLYLRHPLFIFCCCVRLTAVIRQLHSTHLR